MNRKRSRRAGAIEIAAWVLGCSLLTSYGAARLLSTAAHDQGLDEFHRARAAAAHAFGRSIDSTESHRSPEVVRVSVEQTRGEPDIERTDPVDLDAGLVLDALDVPASVLPFDLPAAPDMTDWSPSRITAYLSTLTPRDTPEAILRIASVDLEVPVYAGTEEWNLNRGAGRIEGTPPVGAGGNTGIAAHRDGYFRALGDVRVGDEISIETLERPMRFRVTERRVVRPEDVDVLAPTDETSVTLVTCYPFYYVGPAPMRYVVFASAVAGSGETLPALSANVPGAD